MRSKFNTVLGLAVLLPVLSLALPSSADDMAAPNEGVFTPASALATPPGGAHHNIGGGDHYVVISSRVGTGEGEPELHMHMSVYYIVKAGHADVTLGSKVEGDHPTTPGDFVGGKIIGGHTYSLSQDDALFIPSGVAHQVVIPKGVQFTYYAFRYNEEPGAKAAGK